MTQEQRQKLLDSQIWCETEEYKLMSESEKRQLLIQVKQEETMKWQLKASKLYTILTIVGLVALGLLLILWGFTTNFGLTN
jgi:hypothetical protein